LFVGPAAIVTPVGKTTFVINGPLVLIIALFIAIIVPLAPFDEVVKEKLFPPHHILNVVAAVYSNPVTKSVLKAIGATVVGIDIYFAIFFIFYINYYATVREVIVNFAADIVAPANVVVGAALTTN